MLTTGLLAVVIVAALYWAGKYVLGPTKKGGCRGCSGGPDRNCRHCLYESRSRQ